MSRDQETPETTPEEADYNKGYFTMPRQLRAECLAAFWNTYKLVLFIAEQTFGWHSRWVALSYDEKWPQEAKW